jgi:5-formyltetrahydrofolate cyclo-ligase
VTVLDEELRFVVPDGPLVDGPFGIRQPGSGRQIGSTDLDMVILPMVVGDVRGNRIGHGTGYYDRAFGFRRDRAAPPVLVGVAHAFQILPSIDARPWDVPLDIIVTDVGILRPGLPMGED